MPQTDSAVATQAAPLVTSPTMIVALLSPEVREATSTYHNKANIANELSNAPAALEVYFSRMLGLTLLTLGVLTVLLTGSVPLSSSLAEGLFAPLHPQSPLSNSPRRVNRKN
jgi:hypothetical protein